MHWTGLLRSNRASHGEVLSNRVTLLTAIIIGQITRRRIDLDGNNEILTNRHGGNVLTSDPHQVTESTKSFILNSNSEDGIFGPDAAFNTVGQKMGNSYNPAIFEQQYYDTHTQRDRKHRQRQRMSSTTTTKTETAVKEGHSRSRSNHCSSSGLLCGKSTEKHHANTGRVDEMRGTDILRVKERRQNQKSG